jgi:hypothetical protein
VTFEGDRLVQAWPHPTLILNEAQPNLLDYAAGGSDRPGPGQQAAEGLFPY